MIASAALQTAVFAALDGNIAGAVADEVLPTQTSPFTVIGETTEVPWETHDTEGSQETITLHVWSNAKGSLQVKSIMAEIDARLHWKTLPLTTGTMVMLKREFAMVIKDEETEGETWRHAIMRFRALISQ